MISKKVENFGSLSITEKGLEYLKKPTELSIPEIENKADFKEPPALTVTESGDLSLLNKLKNLRKKIADIKSIPPYVIFQDPSLVEMSIRYPVKFEELSSIFGVGEGKSKKYGKEIFISLVNKFILLGASWG